VGSNPAEAAARPIGNAWSGGQQSGNNPFDMLMTTTPEAKAEIAGSNPAEKAARPTGWSFEAEPSSGESPRSASVSSLHISSSTDNAGDRETLQAQPARFTLPDDIKTLMRPGGQAISIKIEPQHLGPARLYLSEHGDKIRARLVVDTAEAKQLVEGSLDRLTRQLAEADVPLESIEVSVSSNGPESDFFERRPGWTRPMRRVTDPIDGPAVRETTTPNLWTPPPSQYVGAGGVNVLA
jgi:hypothetical protein